MFNDIYRNKSFMLVIGLDHDWYMVTEFRHEVIGYSNEIQQINAFSNFRIEKNK